MRQNTTRKNFSIYDPEEDRLTVWKARYIEMEIIGDRKRDIEKKIELQLSRFIDFFRDRYGYEKVTAVVKRDVTAWLEQLYHPPEKGGRGYAPATVNNHQAALSRFMKWLRVRVPHLLPEDPTKGIREIMLPDPKPRTLTSEQIVTLKNICDRLERFHLKKDRRRMKGKMELKTHARPQRDRAIVYVLLSTGLRREELVNLNLDQVEPSDPVQLRAARSAKIVRIRGKGKTEGTEYLSADARAALADYLEFERHLDHAEETIALFLSAKGTPARKIDGRLYPRSINRILEQIGKWHDAELKDPDRHLSPLRPHDLRHTFANELAKHPDVTEQDLERLLRHRNKRYLTIYTRPPEATSAGFVEKL
ncbi:tyrosine-type recombinase/integrase [Paenibacillus sp. Soil522]|uniref:tyrosine-type recombinase/integrase n=1 Tax=Paenibacillus sp. Soil522 TaxID=1736388 RepID=UPI0006F8012A|nr:tyrosine-type recombinase/integrase [Paenibacillus sp. Soil522]KRE24926.1 site-specific recombinase [Paenibacillus sp. Soil522]